MRRELVGWKHVWTGAYWPLPAGHKPPEHTVHEAWEPVYLWVRTRPEEAP